MHTEHKLQLPFSSCLKCPIILFFLCPPKFVIMQSFSHTVFNKRLVRLCLPDLGPILKHDKFPADGRARSCPHHRASLETTGLKQHISMSRPLHRVTEGWCPPPREQGGPTRPQREIDAMLFRNHYKWKPSSTQHLFHLQLSSCPSSIFLLLFCFDI